MEEDNEIKSNKNNASFFEICSENLSGKSGLEIAGPSRIFTEGNIIPIYPLIKSLDCCNFSTKTIWQGNINEGKHYRFSEKKEPGYQFICDGTDLKEILSKKYDFILASHVLEHIANPLKAVNEWVRVLKNNGILLLALPYKNKTFDHNRPITSFNHLIKDFENNIGEDDLTHLPEILKLHDLSLDKPAGDLKQFKKRSQNNYDNRCLHHHVFDEELITKIFNYFKIKILKTDLVLPRHILIIGEKK